MDGDASFADENAPRVSLAAVAGVGLFAAACLACHLAWGWVPLLDSANLALHEAGHPLVGGGDHDWAEIFSRWHVLGADTVIAGLTRVLAVGLMAGTMAWLVRRWRADDDAA